MGSRILRTGSVGGRNVEDLIKTIAVDKRKTITEIREHLLSIGYSEDVEYDPINVEPIITYSKYGKQRILLKHKWALRSVIIIHSELDKSNILASSPKLGEENRVLEDGETHIISLDLDPTSEKEELYVIASIPF